MSKAKAASKAVAPIASGNKSLALVDAELNQEMSNLREQIGAPTGRNIKVEASGNFKTPEGMDLGDQIQIVVLDFASSNKFYPQAYNPQNPTPPVCYAIGKIVNAMKPEADSPERQNADCATCSLNAFGSGNGGKSKACKNTRELAVLLVDPENPDAHNEPDAPIYTMSIPPTSIKAFDAVVPVIARALGGPPIKAIVTVTAKPVGTYATMSFTNPVANPDYAAHVARRAETGDLLNRKPDFAGYAAKAQAAPPPRRGAAPSRPQARVAAGGRR